MLKVLLQCVGGIDGLIAGLEESGVHRAVLSDSEIVGVGVGQRVIAGVYQIVASVVEDDRYIPAAEAAVLETTENTVHRSINQFLRCVYVVFSHGELGILVEEVFSAGAGNQRDA